MNPTMEKMTKPANMLVKELMQQTMTESLYGRDKAQGSHCHAYITSLSTRHTLSRGVLGGGRGRRGGRTARQPFCIWRYGGIHFYEPASLKMAASGSCFPTFGRHQQSFRWLAPRPCTAARASRSHHTLGVARHRCSHGEPSG